MVLKTKSEIEESVKRAIQDASPQLRVDVDKGPFYYLAARGVAQPLADASASTERLALLSTLQFPVAATNQEASALARAFGLSLGTGGFASGLAYVYTSRRPSGTQTFTIAEGDVVSTSESSGGISFEATESRTLSESNAETFYNPFTRRFELPVRVTAVSAGVEGNIPARTLTTIRSGASDFEGATNLTAFSGGSAPQTIADLYARAQQRLLGLDSFSRGGLVSFIQNVDIDRIQAVALTYSSEYPTLFYRLPDKQAVDAWVLNTPSATTTVDTFSAQGGQTQFVLLSAPVLSLLSVQVNGVPAAATLSFDQSLGLGRSTRESSYVTLATPASTGDVVDITYSYDSVLEDIQDAVDGYLNAEAGALFSADVLVRYPRTLPVQITVTGSVLGTFDPTSVETEVAQVIGSFIANGTGDDPILGGVRNPADLRDAIRARVPGIATLSISVFCRKSVGPLVETIDIPRNSQLLVEGTDDVLVRFT